MRKHLVAAVGCLLLAVGCADDKPSVSGGAASNATTVAGTPSESSATLSSTETSPSTAPAAVPADDSSVPPTEPSSAAASAAPESITPVVTCTDGEITYFGYVNSSDAPVTVPAGSNNRLLDSSDLDDPLLPSVFAPGEVNPAFYATIGDADATPSWAIVGPDGVSRSAAVTEVTPFCFEIDSDDLDAPDLFRQALSSSAIADPRTPDVDVTASITSAAGVEPVVVEVEIALTGVPATSVCHPAFDPLPVETWFDLPDGTRVVGGRVRQTVTLEPWETNPAGTPIPHGVVQLTASVVDNCSAAGETQRSWPLPTEFDSLGTDITVCLDVPDGELVDYFGLWGTCGEFGFTGGGRIRTS